MLGGGDHIQSLPTAVLGSLLVGVLPRVELHAGKLIHIWSLQLELLAILPVRKSVSGLNWRVLVVPGL